VLDVKSTGGGGIVQCAVSCAIGSALVYYRGYIDGVWTEWSNVGEGTPGTDLPPKDSLANMSWEDISKVCRAGKAAEYWSIGDVRTLLINNIEHNVILVGLNHDTATDSSAYGREKAGATFMMENTLVSSYKMISAASDRTGWPDCWMRNTQLESIITWIDSDAQSVIVPVNKVSYTSTKLATTSDKLFLASEVEVFGKKTNAYTDQEGKQYAYYSAGNSKAKKTKSGAAKAWWLRSLSEESDAVSSAYGYLYCYVTTAGAAAESDGTKATACASFFFCV
jgi:hypothetical protein